MRNDYENRLRKIFLHSADVLPGKVSSYLKQAAKSNHWLANQEILREYKSLVEHVPKNYADFILEILATKRVRKKVSPMPFDDLDEFGFEDHMFFFPPAHIQGPFLYLLQKHEDQGLRLIHGLVNTAVQRWRERLQNIIFSGKKITPLPIRIKLKTGFRQFWGDHQVYYWYRPNAQAPASVISALMALEFWAEQQIKSGRDAKELFRKLLEGSDCVAVIGICLGVALAFPDQCLSSALPLVTSPAVWLLDINRFAADNSVGSLNFDPFGNHKLIYKVRAERDGAIQRKQDVRNLVMRYMLGKNKTLQKQFKQVVMGFSKKLPFLYEEQRNDPSQVKILREEVEGFKAYANMKQYRSQQISGNFKIWVEPPERIKRRNKTKIEHIERTHLWQTMVMWALSTIKERKAAPSLTLEKAVGLAKQFQKSGDFTAQPENYEEAERQRGIAGIATAILVADFEWANQQNHITWCRDVLMAAARMPYPKDIMDSSRTVFPLDPRVMAAHGLTALVCHSTRNKKLQNDLALREQIIHLVSDPHFQVVSAIFSGLYSAWEVDEILCWNALCLGLSLCIFPKQLLPRGYTALRGANEKKWVDELVKFCLENLRKKRFPKLPPIRESKNTLFMWDLPQSVLHAVPFQELVKDPTRKRWLLQLTDDLMAWTIAENTPPTDKPYTRSAHPPFEWNDFFMSWVAELAGYTEREETEKHILSPIQKAWPDCPQLTRDFLDGLITKHLGFMDTPPLEIQNIWREMCFGVLDSPELAEAKKRRYLGNDMLDAVSIILYVRCGQCLLKSAWPHCALFRDITEKWVKTIAHNPEAYSFLITMLEGPGNSFCPHPSLNWLCFAAQASSDMSVFLQTHENGARTAELLGSIWAKFGEQIRKDKASLENYSWLIDQLVASGVPLASMLQTKLEGINR